MFDLGDVLPFSALLYDAPGGSLTNAATVTLTITQPDGTAVEGVSVTNPPTAGDGQYSYSHTSDQSGRYVGRWVFTMSGSVTEAYTEAFDVAAEVTSAWPPLVSDVKQALRLTASDTRDDERLASALAAAVAHVEEARAGDFNFLADEDSELAAPTHNLRTGTVRLAVRWYERLRSPEGLVDLGELGSARIPSVDPDIERLLGIGRYRLPYVA